jgi:hypothetical protein
MKKIILNAPRRAGSTLLSMLIRACLPVKGTLYYEKIDVDHSLAAKIDLWKTYHQNQIQVSTVRDPYDVVVSLLTAKYDVMSEKNTDFLEDDLQFVRSANVYIKTMEKYYKAIYQVADNDHIAFDFNDIKTTEGRRAIIDYIFEHAGIPQIDDDFFELAEESALVDAANNPSRLRHLPNGKDESYILVREKLELLKDSIPFTHANIAYQNALTKCINI